MKFCILLLANLTSLAAVIGAIILAHDGITEWSWFLFFGLMTVKTPTNDN